MNKFVSKRLCAMLVLIAMIATFMCPFTVSAEGSFKVIFDGNGGLCMTESLMTKDDGTLDSLPDATRPGYIFGGWHIDPEEPSWVNDTYVFDETTTVFAHWTKMEKPAIKSPEKDMIVVADLGKPVEFSVNANYAEEITWFLNKNDGSDVIKLEEPFFTTVTIDEVTKDYEGYVYYCEIRNSVMADDEPSVLSPAFTIDVNGVEKDYDLPEPEPTEAGLADWAIILIVFGAVILLSVAGALIVTKTDKSKKKKKK